VELLIYSDNKKKTVDLCGSEKLVLKIEYFMEFLKSGTFDKILFLKVELLM
jgi:hypothetical protein